MAETSKEQVKNSEIRSRNTEQTLNSERGITAENKKQQNKKKYVKNIKELSNGWIKCIRIKNTN